MSDLCPNILVSGLSFLYRQVNDNLPSEKLPLLGPALYTALGAKMIATVNPALLTTVSMARYQSFIQFCFNHGIDTSYVSTIDRPQINFISNSIISNHGYTRVTDDPNLWSIHRASQIPQNWPLLLANNDPLYFANLLGQITPVFIAIDLYRQWISLRSNEIQNLIKHVHLICGTESEFNQLGSIPLLKKKNPTALILVKQGKKGIQLHFQNNIVHLPPPVISTVRCDIGAGDLLFGNLSTACYLAKQTNSDILQSCLNSYQSTLPFLKLLLTSNSPYEFISQLMKTDSHEAKY